MFTGIVQETGVVEKCDRRRGGMRLAIRTSRCGRELKVGDSLAVNGCCLTVAKLAGKRPARVAAFDLLEETLRCTNLDAVEPGSKVNLEMPLAVGERLGGHFVTGHIDGLGRIARLEKNGADYVLDIDAPPEVRRYLVAKGSIAVDGVSLTIAAVRPKGFRVWLIPHTWNVTAFRQRKKGDAVNLEADLLGKYVERFTTTSAA